jgi:hypothetical protein
MVNYKRFRRNWWWPNSRHYSNIYLEALKKTTKVLSQDSRYSGQYLNPGLPKHEAGVLITPPQRFFPKRETVRSPPSDAGIVKVWSFISAVAIRSLGVLIIKSRASNFFQAH